MIQEISISNLPIELIQQTFGFLTFKENLLSVVPVCKEWKASAERVVKYALIITHMQKHANFIKRNFSAEHQRALIHLRTTQNDLSTKEVFDQINVLCSYIFPGIESTFFADIEEMRQLLGGSTWIQNLRIKKIQDDFNKSANVDEFVEKLRMAPHNILEDKIEMIVDRLRRLVETPASPLEVYLNENKKLFGSFHGNQTRRIRKILADFKKSTHIDQFTENMRKNPEAIKEDKITMIIDFVSNQSKSHEPAGK